jgi:hypothetical protein
MNKVVKVLSLITILAITSFLSDGCSEKEMEDQGIYQYAITFVNTSTYDVHMWIYTDKCNESNKVQPGGSLQIGDEFDATGVNPNAGERTVSVGRNGVTVLQREISVGSGLPPRPILVVFDGTTLKVKFMFTK